MTNSEQIIKKARKLQEEGKLDEALLLLRRAQQADPHNPDVYFGLAGVACSRGKLNNAEKLAKKAVQLAPHHAAALTMLGTIYMQQQWYGWAMSCFRKALAADPAYALAYNNFALTLLSLGDVWAAEQISREGLKANPRHGQIYAVLGSALHRQGRTAEAIKAMKEGLRYAENNAEILCNIGTCYADIGDSKKAEPYIRKALKASPDFAEANYMLSHVHRYKRGDPHIASMENILKKTGHKSQQGQRLHFALGKAYDDIKDYDRAFAHYAQGNLLVRSGLKYNAASTAQGFAAIKKAFDRPFTRRALKPRADDPVIIFIVGMPRSGTTLTEQILACHPQVQAAGETSHLDNVLLKYKFSHFKTYDGDIGKFPAGSLRAIRDEYLEKLRWLAPKGTFITEKMPTNFRFIGMIRLLFPQAKIIHCRRDPMDSCFSIYKCMFNGFFPFAYDLKELGQYYKCYEDLMAFWHKKLPGFIHDVQYEELVADQEKVTRDLLKFCGLKWNPACLDFHNHERTVMTASALQVKKPLYKHGVGSWRKYEKHLALLSRELS